MPVAPSSVAEKNSVWRSFEHLGDDPADRRFEAHVEHPVGLVEDEDADAAEGDGAAGEQVLEPARGGDDDVGAAGRGDLGAEADAAVDGADPQLLGAADRVELVDDLAGELAGRRQDQSGEVAAAGLDQVDHRDSEGEGLAGPGRGLDEQVVAGERVADDHLLDGEGLGDVALRERAHHRIRDAEIGKRHEVMCSLLCDSGRSSSPKTREAHGGNGTSRVAETPSPTYTP